MLSRALTAAGRVAVRRHVATATPSLLAAARAHILSHDSRQSLAAVPVCRAATWQTRAYSSGVPPDMTDTAPAPVISFEEVMALTKDPKPNTVIVDVREPFEYQKGFIPGAKLLPLGEVSLALGLADEVFEERYGFSKFLPDTNIIFHCRSGRRSETACQMAKEMGYRNVRNYKGSWLEWAERTGVPAG
eukprot:comp22869_c0_seq1/m.36107 comp22869_c0_seq1/g.36107  ORF comp22869_c0_seq1/g.36107 comp22869_c0_seq1/m.36107 type:complete len:189 (-) comp22869_c0_seq1:748-1314(-)